MRRQPRRRILLGVGVFVAVTLLPPHGSSAFASVILFDNAHDQPSPFISDPAFSSARAALAAAGHTLEELTGGAGAITTAALAGVDVFFLDSINVDLTPGETTALQGFIDGGGGVIVLHDGGWSTFSAVDSVNALLLPYGMQFASSAGSPSGLMVSGHVDDCATTGVSTVGLDYFRALTSITPPAVDLTTSSTNYIARYDEGGGWVIAMGDSSLWTDVGAGADYDISDFANEALLLSVFGYDASCASGGGSAPFRRGDTNGDAVVDISDAVFGLASLFVIGASMAECFDAADANDDGTFDISDNVFLLASLFIPGSDPFPAPGLDCGSDPTVDTLDCPSFTGCP